MTLAKPSTSRTTIEREVRIVVTKYEDRRGSSSVGPPESKNEEMERNRLSRERTTLGDLRSSRKLTMQAPDEPRECRPAALPCIPMPSTPFICPLPDRPSPSEAISAKSRLSSASDRLVQAARRGNGTPGLRTTAPPSSPSLPRKSSKASGGTSGRPQRTFRLFLPSRRRSRRSLRPR